MADGRIVKVLKLHILKPAGDMKWDELASLLREARYRVFRLANLAMSEHYLAFHNKRHGGKGSPHLKTISDLNRALGKILDEEKSKKKDEGINSRRFSKEGALPSSVTDALSQYKLRAVFTPSKWSEVARGQASLPSFRLEMAIPVRCDKDKSKRLRRTGNNDIEAELMICLKPYPRVVIATARNSLSDGQRAVLERLLANGDNSEAGYRQRCFEIKHERRSNKWYLLVTYDFPVSSTKRDKNLVVGVDLGFACPLYAAINNGHARLGRRQFAGLAHRIRSLQRRLIKRRREIQRSGENIISDQAARSGHGRVRKLQPIEKLQGKIDRAYTTLNHQLSSAVIKFALDHGAGIIQMEDLEGLREEITGTFLGERWRYEELQRFITYKAKEKGIVAQKVNPRYTSRRCSECGTINKDFTRAMRDSNRENGKSARFECPKCHYKADADYNAARNLATPDIANLIKKAESDQA